MSAGAVREQPASLDALHGFAFASPGQNRLPPTESNAPMVAMNHAILDAAPSGAC